MHGNDRSDVSGIVHEFVQLSAFHYAGFVYDRRDLKRRFVVEILINQFSVAVLLASDYDAALQRAGFGDGCYRFDYNLDPTLITANCTISARIANKDEELTTLHHRGLAKDYKNAVHATKDISYTAEPNSGFTIKRRAGKVSWSGGLTIAGHVSFERSFNDETDGQHSTIVVKEGGRAIVEKTVIPWQGIKTSVGLSQRNASFMLELPLSFADGVPHKLEVSIKGGASLEGSPIEIYVPNISILETDLSLVSSILYTPGITQQFLSKLLCCSVPLNSGYEAWSKELQRLPMFPQTGSRGIVDVAVLIIGSEEELLVKSLKSLEGSADVDWVAVSVPASEQNIVFENSDLIAAVDEIKKSLGEKLSAGTPLVVISAGTTLHPWALHVLGTKILDNVHLDVVYADYEITELGTAGTRRYPRFLPGPDYERWIEQAYPAHIFASSYSKIEEAAHRRITSTYRLCNALIDHIAPAISKSTSHLPVVLANCHVPTATKTTAHKLGEAAISHLRARGLPHCTYSLRNSKNLINISRTDRTQIKPVSVILENTAIESERTSRIFSLLQQANIHFEILTNDGFWKFDPHKATPLERKYETNRGQRTVLAIPRCFSSRAEGLNSLIADATFELIAFFDASIEPVSMEWVANAIDRLYESNVGAISPVIRYADGTVREAGVTFGSSFDPDRGLAGTGKTDYGYMDILQTSHERSSLSLSCCIIRKQSWHECCGFNGSYLPNFLFDIDLFLHMRAKGFRLIVQPCDDVMWLGSEPTLRDPQLVDGLARELGQLRSRWSSLMCDDPSYNPNLGLPESSHSLAWPPRSLQWRGGDAGWAGAP